MRGAEEGLEVVCCEGGAEEDKKDGEGGCCEESRQGERNKGGLYAT